MCIINIKPCVQAHVLIFENFFMCTSDGHALMSSTAIKRLSHVSLFCKNAKLQKISILPKSKWKFKGYNFCDFSNMRSRVDKIKSYQYNFIFNIVSSCLLLLFLLPELKIIFNNKIFEKFCINYHIRNESFYWYERQLTYHDDQGYKQSIIPIYLI